MQGIPEMREWQASFIPQEANRATIQQYSLDIGRPSHGSPCLPARAKDHQLHPFPARLKPCPDTRLALSWSSAVEISESRIKNTRPDTRTGCAILRSEERRVGKE